jgi:arylsulfatase A-like enzyme
MRKTYLFFTSDNGLLLGAHRLIFKDYLYEEALRVPLLVRGPKFPRRAVRDQLVSNVDLAPTIAALTKVVPGRTMDGRSLVPFAKHPGYGVPRELLFEARTGGNNKAIRSGNWIYIDNGPGDTPELYNLATDPFQLQSQHANPAFATIRNQLAARLDQLKDCAGASCP